MIESLFLNSLETKHLRWELDGFFVDVKEVGTSHDCVNFVMFTR